MDDEPEFNADELQALVRAALEEQVAAIEGRDDSARTLFAFGDTRILSVIDEVFSKWIPREELSVALGELRDRLYAEVSSLDIHTLHTIMSKVKSDRDVVLPSWNVQNPDVMLVSPYPPYGEEPTILVDCLKESGFSSRHCVWTWVNRSGGDGGIEPWLPFLFHEIRIWRPKLIVGLGAGAVDPLLGEVKMGEVHGVVHWMGPWAIMPCYSPTYAAKSSKINQLVSDLRGAHEFVFGRA